MRYGVLLLAAVWAVCSSGCGTIGTDPVYLDVFGCLIPVPPGYAFNTIDSSTTHAYSADLRKGTWGELNVWAYDGPIPQDRYEIVQTQTRGRLEIEEIQLRNSEPGDESLIVVTDGVRKLSLGGDARRFVDSMVDACLESSR